MAKCLRVLILCLFTSGYATPQYYCTAANAIYFEILLNLIGGIHEHNYSHLEQIAVFDLGLSEQQLRFLNTIDKVETYQVKESSNPYLLKNLFGCLWKPVVIKEALELFPYVLWLDAGTTVLKPLDDLFAHIAYQGYFISTMGDYNPPLYPISHEVSPLLFEEFHLGDPDRQWMLSQEGAMGGVVGASRKVNQLFMQEWYELAKDPKFCSSSGSLATDQALLSILGCLKHLTFHHQDFTQQEPTVLVTEKGPAPFFLTWNKECICEKTCLYSSRADIDNFEHYFSCIRYKSLSTKSARK